MISLLVATACGLYALFLGQDKNWDLLNYHLYNPYSLLNDRVASDLGPAGLQSWFSPMLDLLYYGAASHFNPRFLGFLLGFLQGLNFYLLYRISESLLQMYDHKRFIALLLAAAGILTVGFQAEIGTSMHDSLVALFPLTSLLIILIASEHIGTRSLQKAYRMVALAGLVAGFGIGLKLVSAVYALGLCLSLLLMPLKFINRVKLTLVFGFPVLFGMFLIGGYWMYETWRIFGNPLFPQFNAIFQGELAIAESFRDTRFLPVTLFDKVFYPVIFTLNPQRVAEWVYTQYSWLSAYIAVLGLLVARIWLYLRSDSIRRSWNFQTTYLLAFFCISYLIWLNLFGIYRYLIVIELLIPLLLFVIISYLLKTRQGYLWALAFVVLLTAVNLPGAPSWGRAGWADTVYRVDDSELNSKPEPAAIYLAGQPVAWVIPALDIATPFLQIVPNFPITEAYWERAKMLVADRPGKHYVLFESDNEEVAFRTEHAMMKLGLSYTDRPCQMLAAYLGASKTEYRYCEVEMTESD